MVDNDTQTERLDKVRLPNGTTISKWENPETGNISYRRNGRFISPTVGEGLEQTTELAGPIEIPDSQSVTQRELNEFGVSVDRETVRQSRLKNKYTEWENFDGLERRRLEGGDSKAILRQRRIKAFMNNETLRREVKNDPLIESRDEQRIAIESYAKQLVDELTNARTEKEEKRILREYGFDY